MSTLSSIYEGGVEVGLRFKRQYDRMSAELGSSTLTRIGLIIGIYLLVRPYIVRFMEWTHKKGEERDDRKKKEAKAAKKKGNKAKAKVSANALRAGKATEELEEPEDAASSSDSSDDEDTSKARTTGAVFTEDQVDKKARRRQRRIDRARSDAEEMRRFEEAEWDEPDLADLLVGRA